MKKVLALVLAVIMVCTMAMAVAVKPVDYETEKSTTVTGVGYMQAIPGQAIVLDPAEDLGFSGNFIYKDKDDNFVPTKNKVAVTFEKGADLIASQGWVKTTEGYKYVLILKENETVVADGTADIIISKIVTSVYGKSATKTITLAKKIEGKQAYAVSNEATITLPGNNFAYIGGADGYSFVAVFDYGWNKGADIVAGTDPVLAEETIYTVVKNTADKDAKVYEWANGAAARDYKIGEKVLFNKVPSYDLAKKVNDEIFDKDVTTSPVISAGELMPNTTVTITLDSQADGTKLYMVKADGTLKDLGAKFNENGVLVATTKVTGPVFTADKALTATAAGSTTPGTTNPGTGANDVVGVAAALAVVALVSGAAISLKK